MESVDQQFLRQKENYEHMTEGELYALAEKAYDLSEIAREALQAVIMAYANDFMLLTLICVLSIPFVFAIGSTASLRGSKVEVEVME